MAETPEVGAAVSQLMAAVQKGGLKIAMYIAMVLAATAPIAIQQTQANRDSSVEYLDPTKFDIKGPEVAEPGSLVRLSVASHKPTDVVWFTVGDSQKYGANGAQMTFAMPDAPAIVTCGIIRAGKLYLTQKTVLTAPVDPEPTPTPIEPTPDPEPAEPEPEPLTAIGKTVLKLAQSANVATRDAKAAARNLRKAADEARGKNPRFLVMRTIELNEDLDLPNKVTEGIQVLLQTLSENGDMVNMEQHLEVWIEMAEGFEAYTQ